MYTFLSKQAGYDPANPKAANNSLSTYATNPLWQVVDGPWKLTHFDASGNITMTANKAYSGPVKPTHHHVQGSAVHDRLGRVQRPGRRQARRGLPADRRRHAAHHQSAGGRSEQPAVGRQLLDVDPLYSWSINYFPYNFTSTGDGGNAGKIFSQLYFRQAVQLLVDQPLYNQKINKGYGVGTYGPVPNEPENAFVSSEVKNNPYPYNPSKAISLLKDHGWTVVPNGTDTCANPGTGGQPVRRRHPGRSQARLRPALRLGSDNLTQLMSAEKSSWASAGITMNISQQSFDTIIGNSVPCSGSACTWELGNWGAGWIFSPDYYPTGEEIFQTGAGSNSGSYSDPTNDANITATNTTQVPLTQYENYLAEQLPVVYQPNTVTSLTEIAKGLTGATPQSVFWALTPENWRFNG